MVKMQQGLCCNALIDTTSQCCFQRAVQSGAFLGTSEMLLFQLMQGAKVLLLTTLNNAMHISRHTVLVN